MNEELILTELREMMEDIKAIKAALYETNGTPGVLSRLRMVENTVGAIKRVIWLCVGGAVTILTTIISLNVFHIKI